MQNVFALVAFNGEKEEKRNNNNDKAPIQIDSGAFLSCTLQSGGGGSSSGNED